MNSTQKLLGPILLFSLLSPQLADATGSRSRSAPIVRARKLVVLRKALPKRAGYRDASIEQAYAAKRALQSLGIVHPAGVPVTRDARGRTYHHESSAMLGHIRRLGVLVGTESLSARGEPSAFPVQLFVNRIGGVTKASDHSPETIKLSSSYQKTELGPGVHLAKLVQDGRAREGWRLEKLTGAEFLKASKGLAPAGFEFSPVKDLK